MVVVAVCSAVYFGSGGGGLFRGKNNFQIYSNEVYNPTDLVANHKLFLVHFFSQILIFASEPTKSNQIVCYLLQKINK